MRDQERERARIVVCVSVSKLGKIVFQCVHIEKLHFIKDSPTYMLISIIIYNYIFIKL